MKIEFVEKHYKLASFTTKIINFFGGNKIRLGKKNSFRKRCVIFKKTTIKIFGTNNSIFLDDFTRLLGCKISIHGNNNSIVIDKRCCLDKLTLCIEDNNNQIIIGGHTSVDGPSEFAAIEGTKIAIGEDCMFSSGTHIRTGDSHVILNNKNERINQSLDIVLGNHCWVGRNVIILKGASVGKNVVIGANSLVTRKSNGTHDCIIAGSPASIKKESTNWQRERK